MQWSWEGQTPSQQADKQWKDNAENTPTKDISNRLSTDTQYTSSENRLETLTLDIQSLKDRTKTILRDQLNRDEYLDPSFLK